MGLAHPYRPPNHSLVLSSYHQRRGEEEEEEEEEEERRRIFIFVDEFTDLEQLGEVDDGEVRGGTTFEGKEGASILWVQVYLSLVIDGIRGEGRGERGEGRGERGEGRGERRERESGENRDC